MVSFYICEGNPGALTFLLSAYDVDMFGAEIAFNRMQKNGITGCKLYILWNDCCGRDTELALKVMTYSSIEKIKEHVNYDGGRGFAFTAEEIEEIEWGWGYDA